MGRVREVLPDTKYKNRARQGKIWLALHALLQMREQVQAKGDNDPWQGGKSGKIGRGGVQRYLTRAHLHGLRPRDSLFYRVLCAAFKFDEILFWLCISPIIPGKFLKICKKVHPRKLRRHAYGSQNRSKRTQFLKAKFHRQI